MTIQINLRENVYVSLSKYEQSHSTKSDMEFVVVLNEDASIPLYLQINESFKKAIAEGTLTAGTKLTSVRQMAQAHNVCKMTIESGYQQLLAEGYIESRSRSHE